jgi:hypothetical protein
MRDHGKDIRDLYSTLLASITYAGKSVPFYDAEPFESVPENYIVLASMDSSDVGTDNSFNHEVTVTLDIVTKANMRNNRDAVDEIANSVLQVLFPDPYVDRLTSNFQVMIRTVTSPGYLRDEDGPVQIQRKLLRINNHLTQIT